jgi:hypothetical protein
MKFFNLICISFLFLISGCNKVENLYQTSIKPINIAVEPGYKVNMDGKLAYIFGSNECPKKDATMANAFISAELDGKNECIVITPETTNIKVMVVFDNHIFNEDWEVVRENNNITYLKRPNGNIIGRYMGNMNS